MTTCIMANHNLGGDCLAIQKLKAQSTVSSSNVGLINGVILTLLSLATTFKSYREQATPLCTVAYHNLRGHPTGDTGYLAIIIVLSKLYVAPENNCWPLDIHKIVLRVIMLKILMDFCFCF